MHKPVMLFVAVALCAGAGQAAAQDRTVRDRSVTRDRVVFVERYQGRDRGRDQREQQTDRSTRTLKIGANGELHIANIAGDIVVTRGGGNDATVEIIKTARGRTTEDAREMLELVQVDISERGGRAEIKTRYPQGDEFRRNNRRNVNVSVDFNVTAPAGARLTIHSISGNISAKDIKGDLTLESVSGTIRIGNGGRVAAAKSVSGNVEVVDTEMDGHLEASSVSGTVLLRNLKARELNVDSVSGGVSLQDIVCDRVEAQSVSGDVDFSGPLAKAGRYELTSHSGNVRVAVAGGTGFELEASSFSGSVRSDIPLNAQANASSRRQQRTLRGIYGDGSAVLDLTTFSGSIVITKR